MITNAIVSFAVITLLFAMIYKVLPDVKIAWRDVWVGAAVTAALFTGGKFLLGWYLGRNTTVSAYGAAGSIILILLWVYYSAQILFFGAEVAKVYGNRYGVRLEPAANARWKECKEPMGEVRAVATHPTRHARIMQELRDEIEELREVVEHRPSEMRTERSTLDAQRSTFK
jgi:membrane protein